LVLGYAHRVHHLHRKAHIQELVNQADSDKDGTLSTTELAALLVKIL
jgi:Ca2+-binding EF-hand superfamily protein